MATSWGPFGAGSAGLAGRYQAAEPNAEPKMDPEALVQCPYDKAHQIRVSRLPYHLVKCQRNNPQVARSLEICPFNARHRMPRAELQRHMACCPDQRQLFDSRELSMCTNDRAKQPKVPVAWQAPPCQEDWEAEVDELEEAAPFILNATISDLPLQGDSTALAAPPAWSQGVGPAATVTTGHLAKGPDRQEQNGPRRVVAQPRWCPPPR
ncbi:gametocyte-specific factor 1-like [Numida meleagris]|uniref:gametocyte-specific factor 1-like n=1 Tax=Numida meleagris TaxID=8996 RepID=UPI000B3DCCFF|nr:gametocyte-specific factor 1-like [Numida meleagris]XP_021239045.1 gametocyte-specific factor 1-like [Numida meleagris]XP_021239046.1 gametocyte-specific factor 1-like [Numida meleagris]XP_021239047.1 gametocyte-specific factor 1-like [Numida meleagris]XP_021239049.1 gametocyte-specific factor 1-like [Numida meleagris]